MITTLAQRLALLLAAGLLYCGLSVPASATTWYLVDATFGDGGAVTPGSYFGWTVYGFLDSTPGSLAITTTAGSILTGYTYALPPSDPGGGSPPGPNGFIITNNYDDVLSIEFQNPLTGSGPDPILVGNYSYECLSFSCGLAAGGIAGDGSSRYFLTGGYATTIAPTPLPAALPLFATGLGAIGLLGWRRKRKAQAIAV